MSSDTTPAIPAASAGVSSAAAGVSTLTNDQDSHPTVLNQGFYLLKKYLYLYSHVYNVDIKITSPPISPPLSGQPAK